MIPHASQGGPINSPWPIWVPWLVVAVVVLMSWSMSDLAHAQEFLWAKQAGGLGNEEGSGIVDSAGNSYVGGEFEGSATFGPGESNETILTSFGLRDIFLAKYDESGNLIWAKRSGGVNDARAGGVLVNDLGHLYSGGEFEGSATFGLGENNETTLTAAGGGASWFGRFDSATGDLLWVKQDILSDSPGFGFDSLGNISIAGSFEGMVTLGLGEPNETTLTSTGTGDIFIAKLTPNGELIEAKKISGVGQEESRVVIDQLDNVYVLGRFVGSLTLGLGEANETMLTAIGHGDVFLAKYNPNGELVWAKHAGGTGDEGIDGIEIDSSGNSFVIGGFGLAAGPGEMVTFRLGEANPLTLTSQGSGDIFLGKYDPNGNLLWVKQGGGLGSDDIEGLAIDALGNSYVLGSFGAFVASPGGGGIVSSITFELGQPNSTTLNSAGLRDLYIAKFDQNGNLLWARNDGGLGNEEPSDISVDGLGNVHATGFFSGTSVFGIAEVNQTTLPSAGGTDFFLAKFGTSSPQNTLTVNTTGSGSGVVRSSDGQIDCGQQCMGDYNLGQSVILIPTPDNGSIFTGFAADNPDCIDSVVNMISPKTCTAQFELDQGPAGIIYSNLGPGDTFASIIGWTIAYPSTTNELAQAAAFSFTPNATFELESVDLAMEKPPGIGTNDFIVAIYANANNKPSVLLASGSAIAPDILGPQVSLPHVTFPPSTFLAAGRQYWIGVHPASAQATNLAWKWNVNESNLQSSSWGSTSLPAVLVNGGWEEFSSQLTEPAYRVNGTRLSTQVALSVTKSGSGSGVVKSEDALIHCGMHCLGGYPINQTVLLVSTADPGSIFSGFTGDQDCADGSVTMDASKSCVATFELAVLPNPVVSVVLAGAGSGTVTSAPAGINCSTGILVDCEESYPTGQSVNLMAVPDPGSIFTGFSGDPDCVDNPVTMDAHKTCIATFEMGRANPVTLDVDGNGVADALTDGMLLLRYLFGFKSEGLVNGVLALDATRTTPEEILAYLDSIRDILLDVDGNGKADAFTDGMLIARFLMGFTGNSLINGVIDPSGNRTSAEAIQGFLSASLPDTTAPIISITSPLSGSQVNSDVITVSGIVDDPTATVLVNGMLAILSGNSFTAEGVPLVQGENTIQATATDPSGNTDSDSVQVTFLPVMTVTGMVLDPKGAPVSEALVRTNTGESSLSGGDGTFFIANVQIGIGAIQVRVEFMVNGVTHHGNSTSLAAVANGITDVGAITIVPPGTGTFLAPAHLAAGLGPRKIVTGDLNRDGSLDLAVANSAGKSVDLWQGQGDGLFNHLPNLNFETSLHSLVIEKFDDDGNYDLAVSRAQPGPFGGENSLSDITCVRLGDGAFGFGPESCVPHPSALALEAGDLNRDGSPDAVAGLKALTAISLMFGRPTGLLNSSSNILVGNGITDDIPSLAIKDIDQDGFLDVAVTSQRAQQVNVLWGNGNGGFSGLDLFSAGTLPTAVTVADFNNDTILDLAVANQGSHDVSVLMGDGARGFLAPMHYPVGTDPVAIVAADFDNDGFTDVGTANKGSNDVSLLLNNPQNGFFPQSNIAVGTAPVSLASGDFNKDGIQDLAVANEGSQNLSILLGIPVENNPPTVNITFPPLNHIVLEGSSQHVSIEAKDDVAVAKVELLIDGLVVGEDLTAPYQFDVFVPLGVSQISFQARATDISDNVTLSEVITCIVLPDDPPTVNIALPLQGANVVEGSTVPFTILANDNIGVVSVDFLVDGQVVFTDTTIPYTFDLLIPNSISTIALGATATDTTGRAGVAPGIIVNVVPISFTTLLGTVVDLAGNPFAGAQVTAADNVASITDTHGRFSISGALASLGTVQAQASLIDSGIEYRGMSAVAPANGGATTLVGPIHLAFGNLKAFDTGEFGPFEAVAGKVNGDDNLDLVVAKRSSGTVAVLIGDGTGEFSAPIISHSGVGPTSLALADFNRDGKLDVAVENLDISETTASVVSIMLGDGLGGFSSPVDLLPGVGNRSLAADDFNKDGNPDLAVARERDNTLSILLGNGLGEFSLPTTLDVGFRPVAVEVGHFNNDTNLDLAVSKLAGQGVSILLGDGLGGFTLAPNSVPCCGTDLALGDFNQDGFLDVVLSNSFVQGLSTWFGDGTGGLSGPNDLDLGITAPFGAPSIEAHHLNNDGHLDVLLLNPTLGGTTVLLGQGEGKFSTPINFEGLNGTFEQALEDINNDGALDIIAPQFFNGTVGISLGLRSTEIDTTPPTVQINSPLSQSNVLEGTILPIAVEATDEVGVKHVTISINGGVVFTDTVPPYNFDFDVPPGSESILLSAQATDFAGNMASSSPIDVTVLLNSPTTFIGSVVNGNTLPVGNAEVTATLGPGGFNGPSVLTNPDGSFTIPNVSSQAGNIVVRGSTTQNNQFLRGNSGSVVPVPNGITDVGQIVLEEVVVPEVFRFTGTFSDGLGDPVPDLFINLFDPVTNRSTFGTTDVDGVFDTALGAGSYTLTATLSPAGSFQSLEVVRVIDLPVITDTVQNFTTAPVVTLSGTVTDSTLNPIPDAFVQVCEASPDPFCQIFVGSVTTNAQGEYMLFVAGDKTYEVSIFPPPNSGAIEEGDIEVIVTGNTIKDFVLDMGVQLSGMIRDAQNNPLAGASVNAFDSVNNSFGFGTADALGQYSMNLPPGIFEVVVFGQLEGIPNFVELLRVPGISVIGNTIQDLTIPDLVTIQGIVTNAGLDPVAGATVEVCRLPPPEFFQPPPGSSGCSFFGINSAVTDGTGGYSMQVPIGLEYDVVVAPIPNAGLLGQTLQGIDVLSSTTQDVMLDAGSQVTGTVVDNQGLLVAGLTVAMFHDTENIFHSALTDANGNYSLTLPDGLFNLEVHGAIPEFPQSVSLLQSTGIQVVGNLVQDVQLPPLVTLSGIVTDGIGVPLSNVQLAVCQTTSFFSIGSPPVGECEFFSPVNSATTNSTGFFSILLPGNLNYVVDVVPEANTGKIPIQIQTLELVSDTVLDLGL